MTQALRQRHPSAVLIAEYWGSQRWLATAQPPTGMGFDIGTTDIPVSRGSQTTSTLALGMHAAAHVSPQRRC
jgi:hypothetical protein